MNSVFYLGKCEGFEAAIKAVPSDFAVTELSSFAGELKEVLPVDRLLASKREGSSSNHPVSKRRKTEHNVSSSTSSCDQQSDRLPTDENWCETKLSSTIEANIYSELQCFAKRMEDSTVSSSFNSVQSLGLGEFTDRDERTAVHRCTRFLYPHLKTLTTPQTGIVTVQDCPNYRKFADVIGHEKTKTIFRFVHVEIPENIREEIELDGEFSKDIRRQLHRLVSSCFGKFLEARTLPAKEEIKSRKIAIRRKPHLCKKEDKDGGEVITAFTLWKNNCETYAAIHHIGRHLNIPHHMFSFAGIKDKRAVTTQKCTVCGISPEKLITACKSLPKYLRVYDAHVVSRVIRLGELDGNRFCLKLTHVRRLESSGVSGKESVRHLIESAVEDVKISGFVNYFGPQRFGRNVALGFMENNSESFLKLEAPAIGLAMLQNDFKKAVNLLLSPTENPHGNSTEDNEAKKHFQATRNAEETLDMMPCHKLREISILRTLKRFGLTSTESYAKALMSLPHNSRLLYVHSFCSFIWNEMATKRLSRYGIKVVPGDLAKSRISGNNMESKKVFVVSEEDVEKGRVDLGDVVLPIPGHQVQYPLRMAEDYKKILKDFGIDENHTFRITQLKLNAPGAYRRLIAFPNNLSLKFLPCCKPKVLKTSKDQTYYIDNDENIIDSAVVNLDGSLTGTNSLSDSEESGLKDKFLTKTIKGNTEKEEEIPTVVVAQGECDGELKNISKNNSCNRKWHNSSSLSISEYEDFDVRLNFDLPPSCYATTFLSEVTKGHMK